jgi:hypothetical protein
VSGLLSLHRDLHYRLVELNMTSESCDRETLYMNLAEAFQIVVSGTLHVVTPSHDRNALAPRKGHAHHSQLIHGILMNRTAMTCCTAPTASCV